MLVVVFIIKNGLVLCFLDLGVCDGAVGGRGGGETLPCIIPSPSFNPSNVLSGS
jgi:hypothetical protein